ncbi:protein FAR1-RELATED SEQUENCE 5 [Elaeis guineensis]|uniref:Protein FAR1-RELATED SEQUENCE 5 n=1 Tax=Elaeis guineensis var. tenera TaxID=51953 RepID=A0A6I9QGB5_ELAGV|nr:protein FAR1-RELATED SEQUENCE 5 [Elaeis guineensis]XP_029117635.1 protein FAR1-RELATED SEQUENCE 5 [Elaeis guineensis]
MEGTISCGGESMETEMGHRDSDGMDYGLELVVERSSGEGKEMPASPVVMFQGGDAKIEPFEGMEFATEEDAWTFYNSYARRLGFNTRISVFHRSRRDGSITSRQFVCAKEGFRTYRSKQDPCGEGKPRRTRAVSRVGCKAMIRVKKQENGRWIVSRLEKAHNHALMAPSRVHCLRSHRLLSESGKRAANDFQRARAVQGSEMLAIKGESHQTKTCYGEMIPKTNVGRGTSGIVEYIKHMQAEDPGFFFTRQLDGDRSVGNVFWADARSRMAYKHFGDVITFDTSYKMNQYQIPFATFTGVNHHRQPVLFGCALIVDDSESSLTWLFEMLHSAMSGRHPTSIISEQDRVIQAAVARAFPHTQHRICKWHIWKESQDKLSHVFLAYPSFKEEFFKSINMTETIDEFESSWRSLVARFDLRDNEWLQSVYGCRHQWVPVYLRNAFFGEMTSAQQCESRSSFFEGYINAQTDAQMFIQQYEKALDSWYEKEVKADFDTIYSLPNLKTSSSSMEKQAAELYTRKIFKIFQEELIETCRYTADKITKDGEMSIYNVRKNEEEHKAYIVEFSSSETTATCSCQMFEYSGILCRHILTVFSELGVNMLPSHYILKRWTRNAKDEGIVGINQRVVKDEEKDDSQSNSQDCQQSLTWRYNSLCREAIKFAEDGATSMAIYNVAIRALQEAAKKVTAAKKNVGKVGCQGAFPKRSTDKENGAAAPLVLVTTDGQACRTLTNDHHLVHCMQGVNLPVSLTTQRQLYPSTIPAAGLNENGSLMLTVPLVSVQKGDPKVAGTASQLPQVLNLVEVGHSYASPGGGSNTASSGSSMQLVAVPMAFCVPLVTNLTAASSAPSNSSSTHCSDSTSPALHQLQLAPHLVAAQQSHTGTPDGAPDSPETVEDPSRLRSAATNSIRAAALAAGARIASPSDAASIIKAVQSKNAIHIRAGELSPSSLKPLGPKPLGRHAANVHFVPVDRSDTVNVVLLGEKQVQGGVGGAMTSCEAGNLRGQAVLHKEFKDEMATDGDSEDQTLEEGAMEFTDSEDDKEFSDAEAGAGPGVSWAAG